MSCRDDISDATLQYLKRQHPEHTPGWLASFQSVLAQVSVNVRQNS